MSPGPTFDRVYLALKEQLASGRFAPGDPLEPAHLGEELFASITPVRDALHRLVGERLVEAPRGDGFRSPRLTEFALRHLYAWNSDMLLLVLRAARVPKAADQELAAQPEAAAELFERMSRLSGNPEHGVAIIGISNRLGPARRAEADILGDLHEEVAALRHCLDRYDIPELRRATLSYHRRRQRASPQILEAMHRVSRDCD